jgi:hypothetical protein
MGIVLGPFFQTPLYFIETESNIFKTLYNAEHLID